MTAELSVLPTLADLASSSSSSSSSSSPLIPLAVSHPPPEPGSSTSTVLQHSFELFCALDRSNSHTLSVDDLREALEIFQKANISNAVSASDARTIMDIVAGASANTLNFAQFHSIYAAVNILQQLSATDLPHLRMKDVQFALQKAGIHPTPDQVHRMFILGDKYKTLDRRGPLQLVEFLKIYTHSSDNPTEAFLHSWFHAGRNSTPYNKHVEISPIQDFLAGTSAGIALTLVGQPFDLIKVRLQTQSGFKGGLDCFFQTVKNEGIVSLFKGMASPLSTIPLVNAVVFWSYASAKSFLHKLQAEKKPLNLGEITLAGAFAGLTNCIITCPVELVKTRLQIQFEPHKLPAITLPHLRHTTHTSGSGTTNGTSHVSARRFTISAALHPAASVHPLLSPLSHLPHPSLPFSGPLDCITRIYALRGIKGLYRGMAATIYREVPGYGGQFFMYEALKRAFTPKGEKAVDLHPAKLVLAGGVAGMFGWLLSYPMDFVKSQLQSEPFDQPTPWKKHRFLLDGGFFDCWRRTVADHGYGALWRGFGPCMARAFPANAAGFVAYELSLKFLRKYDSY